MNAFEFRPVFNMLSTLVKDWIPIVDEYHYCKSTVHSAKSCLISPPQIRLHDNALPIRLYVVGHERGGGTNMKKSMCYTFTSGILQDKAASFAGFRACPYIILFTRFT